MQITWFWYAPVFLLGLVFGSFFNVAIHRWPQEDPKEREWVRTPSHCPKCGAPIRWHHNIPLVSYLMLGGKCYDCKAPISWRYPAVELGTAVLWVVTMWLAKTYGLAGVTVAQITGWHIFFAILFASLYMLTVIIDFQTGLIPDEISILHFLGAAAFLIVCNGATISPGLQSNLTAWQSSLVGMFVLSGFFFILALFGWMGLGDVKLAVGFGVLFGWQLVIAVGYVAVMIGGIISIVLLIILLLSGKYKKKIPIPFGPYLAVAAYVCMFAGNTLVTWYLGFFRAANT